MVSLRIIALLLALIFATSIQAHTLGHDLVQKEDDENADDADNQADDGENQDDVEDEEQDDENADDENAEDEDEEAEDGYVAPTTCIFELNGYSFNLTYAMQMVSEYGVAMEAVEIEEEVEEEEEQEQEEEEEEQEEEQEQEEEVEDEEVEDDAADDAADEAENDGGNKMAKADEDDEADEADDGDEEEDDMDEDDMDEEFEGEYYKVGMCGIQQPANQEYSCSGSGCVAYMIDRDGYCYCLGQGDNYELTMGDRDAGDEFDLMIVFSGGDSNGGESRSVVYELTCSEEYSDPVVVADEEGDEEVLVYYVLWSTPGACKQEIVDASEGKSSGMSWPATIAVVFCVAFAGYCIVGSLYNRTVHDRRGTEMIPNRSFWNALAGKSGTEEIQSNKGNRRARLSDQDGAGDGTRDYQQS